MEDNETLIRRLKKALKLLNVVKEKYRFEREVSTELANRNEGLRNELELEKAKSNLLLECYNEIDEIAFSCIDADVKIINFYFIYDMFVILTNMSKCIYLYIYIYNMQSHFQDFARFPYT